ncbi:CHAT domain-containing protein [Sphingopyxis sp. SE2]|jgi:CHAT domain-containing protein|uniref:CHAT domain-containing tetratricopeptide repeat protein n=1 Tax=unclassified Sphingopyxis TaxID=2614943 RepID=UPI00050E61B6|nr:MULTISPECIES: CHAT domain-containing tetratricopeptide repeat protein [unclassified Sphingopyxis]KGB57616.1 Tetratricopeptide TPR_2 repeat protein precursor [Sphingopyxis sp. LC363]MDT7529428.1 CHAT domain-containing protein [Sphingopyxis sp. SE2]
MASRRLRFFALLLAAPLWTTAPTGFAQEAPPPAKLDGDEQKLLDLLNRGMDLERAGKRRDAEAVYRRWTGEATKRYGADNLITSMGYRLLAGVLEDEGRLKEAEPFLKQLLAINRASLGESDDETLLAYARLSANYMAQGRPVEAIPLRRAILVARLASNGKHHPKSIIATSNLARAMAESGDMKGAEPLYREAVESSLAVHGENHRETAANYGNLATVLSTLGRFDEAAPIFAKVLAIEEALPDGKAADIALSHYNVSANFSEIGRYDEASAAANKALDLWRAAKGDESAEAALGYTAVANSLRLQGRYAEADAAYRKALAIRLKALGETHPLTGEAHSNVALIMENRGLPPSAIEPLLRKALDITRQAFGESSHRTAIMYGNVAHNLVQQGRFDEAEPMYRRSIEIQKSVAGADHPSYATQLINLAYNLGPEAAEPLMREALGIFRAKFGDDNPETAHAYASLGTTLSLLGRHAEGAEMAIKALAIRRRLLGEDHPLTADGYASVAAALVRRSGLDRAGDEAAEPYYRQALAIRQRSLGEAHIETAHAYSGLAASLLRQGKAAEAEAAAAKAVAIVRRLNDRTAAGGNAVVLSALDRQQVDPNRDTFTTYMNAAFGLMSDTPDAAGQSRLQDLAFQAAQDANSSASGRAVLQSAARSAAKTPQMAEAVRREQDLAARANVIDKNLLRALGNRKSVEAARLRGELDGVQAELADIGALIDKKYPSYRQLVSPRPVGLAEAQKALRPGEALLMMTEAANTFHLFVVTPDAVGWSRPAEEIDVILKQISDLRCDVDFATCSAARKAELDALPMTTRELEGHRRFDLDTAHALYKELIAPVEPLLKDTRRLYVASSGKLGDLPLAMLSSTPLPEGADLADPDTLARAGWLADRYAFTSLPSVAALMLPVEGRTGRGKNFRGYGAPVLLGGDTGSRAAAGIGVFDGVSAAGSPLADPDALRKLAPLPGTKVELAAMAELFGAAPASLTLDRDATEAALRGDPALPTSDIVAIATHGLLPDPELGFGEPGLVLTPPGVASDTDDGLLTATEAARLTLSADWVILSACNTASVENSGGGDSLSALARGFLYAGADALLASHWRVSDQATAVLTVETLTARRANPGTSRAEALQMGMKAVRSGKRADGSAVAGWKAGWAHPAAWAAFTNIANRDD